MDKNGIRKYASFAREQLCMCMKETCNVSLADSMAYTWFMRLAALRYMEVNGYLTQDIKLENEFQNEGGNALLGDGNRIFTDDLNHMREDLTTDKIFCLCHILHTSLPQMFQRANDESERVFSEKILAREGVVWRMIEWIPEEDWKEQVEILGWLHQYYHAEKKEEVFAELKNNIKISKENIPAATQLFTPDWVVHYLVEKSILPEEDENITVMDPCCGSGNILVYAFDVLIGIYDRKQIDRGVSVRQIVEQNLYGLDLDEDAVKLASFSVMMKARQYDKMALCAGLHPNIFSIVESNEINPYGVEYVFGENVQSGNTKNANVVSNHICDVKKVLEELCDAKEYGSLISISPVDFDSLLQCVDTKMHEISIYQNCVRRIYDCMKVAKLLSTKYDVVVTNPPYMGKKSLNKKLSDYLDKKFPAGKSELYSAFILRCMDMTKPGRYTAMVTMHSWMFLSSFSKLREMVLSHTRIVSMMHTGAATFEELNAFNVLSTAFVLKKKEDIIETDGTKSFEDRYREKHLTEFIRLADYYTLSQKLAHIEDESCKYYVSQESFLEIPGAPFVYWVSEYTRDIFKTCPRLRDIAEPRQGLATGDNARFVRLWHEVDFDTIGFGCVSEEEAIASGRQWFPYNKGGYFRKWYGMNEYVVDWKNGGYDIRHFTDASGKLRSRPQNTAYYFKPGITWSLFGFENFAVRYKKEGFVFDVSGSSVFPDREDELYILAFLAGKVAFYFLSVLAPTVNFQVGNIGDLPLIIDENKKEEVTKLVRENISLSKEDWDSYENSWDYTWHPFMPARWKDRDRTVKNHRMELFYESWKKECDERYNHLKENEERLNEIFIGIYGLEQELSKEVVYRDVTVHKIFDRKTDIIEPMKNSAYIRTCEDEVKSFISYAIGCIFGRYSVKDGGINIAGREQGQSADDWEYPKILVVSREKIEDGDIVDRFIEFVSSVFGEETLQENLLFIARAIGLNRNETYTDAIRRYFVSQFYDDHCRQYQKKPIYWMFETGRKSGIKFLIYIHRYTKDILRLMREEYVLSWIDRDKGGALELTKEQRQELLAYAGELEKLERLDYELALEDGVSANYKKLSKVLARM